MRTITGNRTLPCDSTVADKLRCKWDGTNHCLTVAGLTDLAMFICDGVPVNGYCSAISRKTADGVAISATGVIGVGVTVYGAANGQVSATQGSGAQVEGVNFGANVNGGYADVQLA